MDSFNVMKFHRSSMTQTYELSDYIYIEYMQTCIHAYTQTYMHPYTLKQTYMHTYIHTNIYVYNLYIYSYKNAYVLVCVRSYAYIAKDKTIISKTI